jgi:hypothetical protein
MSTRNLPGGGGKGRPTCKANNLTYNLWAECLEKIWEPQRLTTLWASTACCGDNFTFFSLLQTLRLRKIVRYCTRYELYLFNYFSSCLHFDFFFHLIYFSKSSASLCFIFSPDHSNVLPHCFLCLWPSIWTWASNSPESFIATATKVSNCQRAARCLMWSESMINAISAADASSCQVTGLHSCDWILFGLSDIAKIVFTSTTRHLTNRMIYWLTLPQNY